MKREGVAELLVSTNIIFSVAAFGAVEPWSAPVTVALSWLTLSLCVTGDGARPFPALEVAVPLAGLALIAGLQALNPSGWPGPSPSLLNPSTASVSASLARGWEWLSLSAFLIGAAYVYREPGARYRALWLLLALGAFIAVLGIVQQAQARLSQDGIVVFYGVRSAGPGMNPFGPFYNRNHAACAMATAFWCGIGACAHRLQAGAAGAARSFEATLIAACGGALCAACLWGIARSGSYGAATGLSFGAAFSAIALAPRPGARRFAAFALIAAALAAAGLLLGEGWAVAERLESWALRREILKGGLALWAERPLWGYGAGGFMTAYASVRPAGVVGVVDYAHNDWLEILFETGLAGFLLVAGGAAALASRVWRGFAGPDRWVACGAAGACGAGIVHGFAEFCLRIPGSRLPFLAATAVLCAVASPARVYWRLPARGPVAVMTLMTATSLLPIVAWSLDAGRAAMILPSARNLRLLASARLRSGDAADSRDVALARWRDGLDAGDELLRSLPGDPVGVRLQGALLERLGRGSDAATIAASAGHE